MVVIKMFSYRATNHVGELDAWLRVGLAGPDIANELSPAWPCIPQRLETISQCSLEASVIAAVKND